MTGRNGDVLEPGGIDSDRGGAKVEQRDGERIDPGKWAAEGELGQIAKRFPEELERIAEWERIVSDASKRGCATFFAAKGEKNVSLERHGIHQKMEWAKTARGGRQYDLVQASEEPNVCQSVYGLCE